MNVHWIRTPRILAVAALAALAALGAGVEAGSNLPGGYPGPMCGERPQVPVRPEKFETEEAISAYNAKVEAYNASMERIVACVRAYIAGAAADIELIRKRATEAVERIGQ